MNPARHAAGCYLCSTMRKAHSNRLAVGLMALSLALLTAFLAFWLRQAFGEQRSLLQKEASHLFARAVFHVQDSLIQDWVNRQAAEGQQDSLHLAIVHFSGDSMPPIAPSARGARFIFSETRTEKLITIDTPRTEHKSEGIGSNLDLAPGLLQNVLIKVQLHDSTAIFPFGDIDSAAVLARIHQVFADSLKEALASLPFTVATAARPAPDWRGISTVAVPGILSKGSSYQAVLSAYHPYLFRKIAPQIAFSLFLIALITASFLLIFQNMQKQRRLAEMRAGLVSNITHELKTPIATISVAIEALDNFNALDDKARTREYLGISRNELHRLSLLVDKVLNMAAFENKELELQFEPLGLKQLTEEILSYLKLYFEKANADVQLEAPEGNYAIQADRLHLTNVLYNLIDNALKYSGDDPVIRISLQEETDGVLLRVTDNGIGIPAEYQKRIFDQFFRVPRGDEHNVKGYGLGLSYVAKVVEKHGGWIKLDSREGVGSSFTVYLPASPIPTPGLQSWAPPKAW